MLKTASILDYAKPGLSPTIFDASGKIHPALKKQILEKLNLKLMAENLPPGSWLEGIRIIGSMTSYQYNFRTDLDVHMLVDLDAFPAEKEEAIERLDRIRKEMSTPEQEMALNSLHPLEFYFETGPESSKVTDGEYNLLTDEWTKEPRTIEHDYDPTSVYKSVYAEIQEAAHDLDVQIGDVVRGVVDTRLLAESVGAFKGDKAAKLQKWLDKRLKALESDISKVIDSVQEVADQRKVDYDPKSLGNIRFKYIQRLGYLWIGSRLKEMMEDGKLTIDEVTDVEDILRKDGASRQLPLLKAAKPFRDLRFFAALLEEFDLSQDDFDKMANGWLVEVSAELPPHVDGVTNTGVIRLNAGLSDFLQTVTLAHEMAHYLQYATGRNTVVYTNGSGKFDNPEEIKGYITDPGERQASLAVLRFLVLDNKLPRTEAWKCMKESWGLSGLKGIPHPSSLSVITDYFEDLYRQVNHGITKVR